MKFQTNVSRDRFLASVLAGFCVAVACLAIPAEKSGEFANGDTWDDDSEDGGYRIVGDVIITGGTLEISPGVKVGFGGPFKIVVEDDAQCYIGLPNSNTVTFANAYHQWPNLIGEYQGKWLYIEVITPFALIYSANFQDGGTFRQDDPTDDNVGYLILHCYGNDGELGGCEFIGSDQNGIVLVDGFYNPVFDCQITGSGLDGILVTANKDNEEEGDRCLPEIEECKISDNGQNGIHLVYFSDFFIEQNLIFGNLLDGILVESPEISYDSGQIPNIANNVAYLNGVHGIAVATDGDVETVERPHVWNNAVFTNGDIGLAIEVEDNGNGDDDRPKIWNNISWDNDGDGFTIVLGDADDETNMDDIWFSNNLTGRNRWGINFLNGDPADGSVEYTAFKANGRDIEVTAWLDETSLRDGDNQENIGLVNIDLVDEFPDADSWDFRLLVDDINPQDPYSHWNALINRGDPDTPRDHDWGSSADIGLFGSEKSHLNVDSEMNTMEDYCLVTDNDYLLMGRYLRSVLWNISDVYRLDDQLVIPQNVTLSLVRGETILSSLKYSD